MKTNFKKITAVAASFLVAGLTLGTASAAQFPKPFKQNGSVDAAIVYGSNAAATDQTAAGNIQSDLDLPSTTNTTIGGSSVDLYRQSSRLYLGDQLNKEKSSALDSDDLPEVLADATFSGAEAGSSSSNGVDYSQEVRIGDDPKLGYRKQPTDEEDPVVGWNVSEDSDNANNYTFSYTLDFDSSVNFTAQESVGEIMQIQGKEYAVSADTGPNELYLTESAEELNLEYGPDSSGSREMEVTIDGKSYTVRLDSATSNSARVTVTGPDGSSDSESIDEDNTKDIGGLTVTPTYTSSDDVGNVVSATLVVSGEKGQIRLANNNSVEVGTDESTVDGTYVQVNGGSGNFNNTDSITVYSSGMNDDKDAITKDNPFTDPAFGNLNVALESFSSGTKMDSEGRETFSIQNNDDETATIDFTSHEGNQVSMEWYSDGSNINGNGTLMKEGNQIHVVENATVETDEYVVLSNEESGSGAILELTDVSEDDSNPSEDTVSFKNVLTGNTFDAEIKDGSANTAEITQFVDTYDLTYNESNGGSVNIDYTGSGKVVFPSIETSEGARLAFTEPKEFKSNVTSTVNLPNGDEDYIELKTSDVPNSTGVANSDLFGGGSNSANSWRYNVTNTTDSNESYSVKLARPDGTAIDNAAVHLIEEESDASEYGSVVVEMGTASSEVQVENTHFTTGQYTSGDVTHESNDDNSSKMDYWGTKVVTDSSGDQDTVEISYPDNQLYANTVLASGTITEKSSGNIMYTDQEKSSWKNKNVIVVGGSAVNSAAAKVLGVSYPTGGQAFTQATGVGQGEYLVKSYTSPWNSDKIALLVAGYSASDTQSAANWVTSNDFDSSSVDQMGPTSGQ